MTEKHDAHTDSNTAGSGDFPAVVDGLEHWHREAGDPFNPWSQTTFGNLSRGDVFHWSLDTDHRVYLGASKDKLRAVVWNVERGGVADIFANAQSAVTVSQVDGYAESQEFKDTAEFDARMAKARAAQPPLPDTLDGMELGNRLLDYDPDTWSQNGRLQIGSVRRGEIISLVLPDDAAQQGEDSITKARPRHFVVLGVSGAGSERLLSLWNLDTQEDGTNRVVSVPAVWPVMIRLDLVYLDDPDGFLEVRDPRPEIVTPVLSNYAQKVLEHAAPVQPVAPINDESTESGTWRYKVTEIREDTRVKYRGVPVPGHLLGDWPDSQDSLAWRAGVNDTLRELGMAEVLPLHLRPTAQAAPESRSLPLQWCGDFHAHTDHVWSEMASGVTTHFQCNGTP